MKTATVTVKIVAIAKRFGKCRILALGTGLTAYS